MNETYLLMNDIANLYEGNANLSQLALMYQKDENPMYLAVTFKKLYKLLLTHVNKFYVLTDSDCASFILQEIHKAMKNYSNDKGVQVQTLISRYVYNRLKAESNMLNHDKRVLNIMSTSYEGVLSSKEDGSTVIPKSLINKEDSVNSTSCYFSEVSIQHEYDELELQQTLDQLNLPEKELKMCKIILSEKNTLLNTEIAKKMGITSAGVAYLKKSLRTKLLPVLGGVC